MKTITIFELLIMVSVFSGCSLVTKESPKIIEEQNLNQKIESENMNKMESYNYKRVLDTAISLINSGHELKINELLIVIPKTFDEYLTMYELTYPEQDSSKQIAFDYIDKQMHELALQGNIDVMKAYLNLSAFIDGEYAESYYDDAEFVIKKNAKLFCDIFRQLTKEAKANFNEVRSKVCPKNPQ